MLGTFSLQKALASPTLLIHYIKIIGVGLGFITTTFLINMVGDQAFTDYTRSVVSLALVTIFGLNIVRIQATKKFLSGDLGTAATSYFFSLGVLPTCLLLLLMLSSKFNTGNSDLALASGVLYSLLNFRFLLEDKLIIYFVFECILRPAIFILLCLSLNKQGVSVGDALSLSFAICAFLIAILQKRQGSVRGEIVWLYELRTTSSLLMTIVTSLPMIVLLLITNDLEVKSNRVIILLAGLILLAQSTVNNRN